MLRKLLLCITFLLFALGTNLKAQDDDTLSTDNDKHNWKWNWDWEDELWSWEKGKPSIEFMYGLSQFKHNDMESDFTKTGLAEIKLGYVSIENNEDNIFEFKEHYAFVSRMAHSLQSEKANFSDINSEILRFGFGKRSGYGYDLGAIRIFPYNENSAVWSKLEVNNYPDFVILTSFPNNIDKEKEILDRYKGAIRFGTIAEGGVRVEIGKTISFNAGYETSVIFPRYMFWKHLVSYGIESAGLNALDNFVDEVFDSSPYAAPLVNFILKNGFSYAFYTLKKDKMNWPFNTETPLTVETFKFGMTFTF